MRREYNLLVESVEFYDDLNIVLAVRRGTIPDLGRLMDGQPGGHTVFYFVNTQNVSMVREHMPWDAQFPGVVAGSGVMCPALRFLPSLGTFVSQSTAGLLYGAKFLVNLLANPFAMKELLAARRNEACPASGGLEHSSLRDCGMALLSLENFFQSLYSANRAFWDILAWLASFFSNQRAEGDPIGIQSIFENFLTGFSVYGDAGHVVSLYEVTDVASVFDTGMQDFVIGGGRRLLGFKMNVAKKAGKGLISGFIHSITGGAKMVFSMSQSLSSTMALKFANADFSVLVASENPTYMLSSAVTVPPLVWAHFTFRAMVPMALDLINMLLHGSTSTSSSIVWVNLYGTKADFEELIDSRQKQGCTALRMMLGYNGGVAKAVYYNCLSAVDMHAALFDMLLIATTDMPLYSCMCVQAAGEVFPDYILNTCMQWVPSARKGIWQSILYQNGQNMNSLCAWYGEYIHDEAQHVLDPWVQDSQLAANALGSFLQDIIAPSAPCTSVESNANVYTLLPTPSDHYQVCGKTSMCQLRCADTFSMFYYALNRTVSPDLPPFAFDVSAESPFFNPYEATSKSLYYVDQRIVAISTRSNTSSLACMSCLPGSCLLLIKTPWSSESAGRTFTAKTYCVPPAEVLKATVYASGLEDMTFTISGQNAVAILTFCDLALDQVELYVLLAFSTASLSISQAGLMMAGPTTVATQQQFYAAHFSSGQQHLLLDTLILSNQILTPAIQRKVFVETTVSQGKVTQCTINALVEIYTGVRGQLLFFFSVSFQVCCPAFHPHPMRLTHTPQAQAYAQQTMLQETGIVHGILQWSDPSFFTAAQSGSQTQLFLPCDSCSSAGCPVCWRALPWPCLGLAFGVLRPCFWRA